MTFPQLLHDELKLGWLTFGLFVRRKKDPLFAGAGTIETVEA